MKYIIAVYVAGSIFTYGHAFNRDYSGCFDKEGARFFTSLLGAAAWPFYWSEVLWERGLKPART